MLKAPNALAVLSVLAAAGAVACAAPARATTLIGLTDTSPDVAIADLAGTSASAVAWTQSVAASNVTVEAVLIADGAPSSGAWWITTAIGPTSTAADIVATGKYAPAVVSPSTPFDDFDTLPMTVLGTGLELAAGSYFLVIGAPPAGASWVGDFEANAPATLAPGFSLGSYFFGVHAATPQATFGAEDGFRYDFALITSGAPEPGAWSLMVMGFGLAGAVLRRRARRTLPA
jgi:hypothetical protein